MKRCMLATALVIGLAAGAASSFFGCNDETPSQGKDNFIALSAKSKPRGKVDTLPCDIMIARTVTAGQVWVYDSRGGPYPLFPKALMDADSSFLACPVESFRAVADSVVYVSGINPTTGQPVATHIAGTVPVPFTYFFNQCCPDTNGVIRTVAHITVGP